MADDKELDEAKKTEKADKAENNKKSRKEKKLEKKLEKEKEKPDRLPRCGGCDGCVWRGRRRAGDCRAAVNDGKSLFVAAAGFGDDLCRYLG